MSLDKVPRESVKLRHWILLVAVLILCVVFDLWLFWLAGRSGRLSFIGAKFFGTLCVGVGGGLAALAFRFSRPQMTSALALVIVSLLFQVAWKPIDTKIYMAGVARTVLATAPADQWRSVLRTVADSDGGLPFRIPSSRLPRFVHEVYPGKSLFCSVGAGEISGERVLGGTLKVWWYGVGIFPGLVLKNEESEPAAGDYAYTKRLGAGVYLVAWH